MRAGKTLAMTMWGCFLSEATGQKIYSNYWLNWDNHRQFKKWKDLQTVRNSIILFDEIGTAMDSRNFKSHDQIYFTHLFAQMGKMGNTFMYSTQREHTVEKRIKDNTDFVIYCEKDWVQDVLKQTWYDTQESIQTPKKIQEFTLVPNKFYSLYDTYEVIKSTSKIQG